MLRYMSRWGKFHSQITTHTSQSAHDTVIIMKAKHLIACSASVLWDVLRAHGVVVKSMCLSEVPEASSMEFRSLHLSIFSFEMEIVTEVLRAGR